jgi:hypothetical protein
VSFPLPISLDEIVRIPLGLAERPPIVGGNAKDVSTHSKRKPARAANSSGEPVAKGKGDDFRKSSGLVQQRTESALRCAPANSVLWWFGNHNLGSSQSGLNLIKPLFPI